MQQWEYLLVEVYASGNILGGTYKLNYKIEGKTLQDQINSLGKQGWELVSVVKTAGVGTWITEANLQYYFKRPILN